jgi:hypothetical protein
VDSMVSVTCAIEITVDGINGPYGIMKESYYSNLSNVNGERSH